MSSGHGIGRNRHRADQQSRSSHNTKITLHEYLQWFDQFTLIVHPHIGGSAVATIKLTFRKLNLILSELVGKRLATYGGCAPRKGKVLIVLLAHHDIKSGTPAAKSIPDLVRVQTRVCA